MKRRLDLWLEPDDIKRLEEKAKEAGLDGRGCVGRYIEKIAREPVCFLDSNVRQIMKLMQNS